MQHLSSTLEGHTFPCACRRMSNPGKVLRLSSNWTTCSTACAGSRQFLWVLALRPYYPGGVLNALASTQKGSTLFASSTHRLGRGLLGYLIPFTPHAFVFQCQKRTSRLLSLLVFPLISTHFIATPGVPSASSFLKSGQYFVPPESWAFGFYTKLIQPSTDALRPINPGNAWGLCITAAAGTELAAPYSLNTLIVIFKKRTLHPEGLLRSRGVAPSGFRPLGKILDSRRSPGSVSVPMVGANLSVPLTVIALVGYYLTN